MTLRMVLIVSIVAMLTGCITVPAGLIEDASNRGAFATNGIPVFGLTWIETASVQAGKPASAAIRFKESSSCDVAGQRVSITYGDIGIDSAYARELCEQVAKSIIYVTAKSKNKPLYKVEVGLSAPRIQYVKRAVYIYPIWGRMYFLVPWDSTSPDKSLANTVDTIAHEVFHATAAVDRIPRGRRNKEYEAYMAGFCAQLHVLGTVDSSQYNGDNRMAYATGDAGVRMSLDARHLVARHLQSLDMGSTVYGGSKQGDRVASSCDKILTDYFQTADSDQEERG